MNINSKLIKLAGILEEKNLKPKTKKKIKLDGLNPLEVAVALGLLNPSVLSELSEEKESDKKDDDEEVLLKLYEEVSSTSEKKSKSKDEEED